MTELTLANINTFLQTNPTGNCNDNQITGVSPSKITDIDTFLMNAMSGSITASPTRKDNFLTLYNDQYVRNLEVVVGILFISAVLAKMMFYPIVI
jgi:hypothetical protein